MGDQTYRDIAAESLASPSFPFHDRARKLAAALLKGDGEDASVGTWSDALLDGNVHVHPYDGEQYRGFIAYVGNNPDEATLNGYGDSPAYALLDMLEVATQRDMDEALATARRDSAVELIRCAAARDANMLYVGQRFMELAYTIPGVDADHNGSRWPAMQWVSHLLLLPGNPRIVRAGDRWQARLGPNGDRGLAALAITRERAMALTATIYNDGSLARAGDVIMCVPDRCPHPVSGVVVDVARDRRAVFVSTALPMALHPAGVSASRALEPISPADEGRLRPYRVSSGDGLDLVAIHTWLVSAPVTPPDQAFLVGTISAWVDARTSTLLATGEFNYRTAGIPTAKENAQHGA